MNPVFLLFLELKVTKEMQLQMDIGHRTSDNIFHAIKSFIEWFNVGITILILIMRPFNAIDYFKLDEVKMNAYSLQLRASLCLL